MASWVERFVAEDGLNLIGGCCGTSIGAYPGAGRHAAQARRVPPGAGRAQPLLGALGRQPVWPDAAAPGEQLSSRIGERCNANGSKKWRELQEQADWDGCVSVGREQVGEGSNSLDICTAFVGRDEMIEMNEVIRRFTSVGERAAGDRQHRDPVIEAALKLHGGKPIINSINFEDGEQAAADRLILAKKFGAAVIALTIDESGMAKTAEASSHRRAAGGVCLRQARPAAERPADRPADLHHRHRQRG